MAGGEGSLFIIQLGTMKFRLLLLLFFIGIGVFAARASDGPEPVSEKSKTNEIGGNVYHSEKKKPLGNVSITAYLISSRKEKVVVSDGNGNYAFEDLKPGVYKFVFEKDGFRKVTKEKVTIRTNEDFQMNIEMIETEDFNFMPGTFNFSDFE